MADAQFFSAWTASRAQVPPKKRGTFRGRGAAPGTPSRLPRAGYISIYIKDAPVPVAIEASASARQPDEANTQDRS
jgi:hypothetical protein